MNDQNKNQFIDYFREIQVKFSRIYVELLSQGDITLPQYVLLSQLVAVGTVPMSEASRRLHLSKPAITNLVDRLEQKKLVRRLPHPDDRRISLLEVQNKGQKLVHQIQSRILEFILKALNEFNEQEKKVVTRFYSLLLQNITELLAQK